MKLEMTLPSRPGLIYMLPGMDILALVLILPLIVSSFKSNAGIEIVLPDSVHRLALLERSVQVSIKGVINPKIWVNKQQVKEKDLLELIAKEISFKEGDGTVAIALQVDVKVPSGYKQRIIEMLQIEHYRVFDMLAPAMR